MDEYYKMLNEYVKKGDIFNELKKLPLDFGKCESADVEFMIMRLSPANVRENVQGHWIRHEYADLVDGYYVPNFECSKCRTWKDDDSDFCPDCGADMRGGRK